MRESDRLELPEAGLYEGDRGAIVTSRMPVAMPVAVGFATGLGVIGAVVGTYYAVQAATDG
ncbi:hypothetical protein [Streptomyces sp. WMMC905]|uniref:hypothetical protein n=1 Tax=Streptomyces sp. WMMC905 TaxID=3404123 RepID=UPI003B9516EC